MKYKLKLSSPQANLSAPSVSGAERVGVLPPKRFIAWQPSTWPDPPSGVDDKFIYTLKEIFEESILAEIKNVISDAEKCNNGLQHRGHVVAIALLCALDAISSYGYGARCGKQIPDFVLVHFPAEYRSHAPALLYLYRHAMVHSWNLFEVAISPGNEKIANVGGSLQLGLLNFFDALVVGVEDFMEQLQSKPELQQKTLERYTQLKNTARP
jgi:hypothetical protein